MRIRLASCGLALLCAACTCGPAQTHAGAPVTAPRGEAAVEAAPRAAEPAPRAEASGPGVEPASMRIYAGDDTTCLLRGTAVTCWGRNHTAQLGDVGEACGDDRCLPSPTEMTELGAVVDLGLGGFHLCVLRADGEAACMGSNHRGQLGADSSRVRSVCAVGGGVVPTATLDLDTGEVRVTGSEVSERFLLPCAASLVPVEGASHVRALDVSAMAVCVQDGADRWSCAGGVSAVAAGLPSCDPTLRPGEFVVGGLDRCARRLVPLDPAVTRVGFSNEGACTVVAGRVSCAGFLISSVGPMDGVQQLSVGGSHLCVVDDSGDLFCGGWNAMGQVGNGRIDAADAPAVQLTRVLSDVTYAKASSDHTCAVQRDGSLWCWGANDMGQVGAGDQVAHAAPTRVEGMGTVQGVALGLNHTCAIGDDGSVWCWGSDEYGALGLGRPARETCASHRIGGGSSPCASRPQRVM